MVELTVSIYFSFGTYTLLARQKNGKQKREYMHDFPFFRVLSPVDVHSNFWMYQNQQDSVGYNMARAQHTAYALSTIIIIST